MSGASSEVRVVRVPLPVSLIRRLDGALVLRLGGFETRAEFIREAVENQLLDLQYEPAPPEPTMHGASDSAAERHARASESDEAAGRRAQGPLREAGDDSGAPDDLKIVEEADRTTEAPADLGATVLRTPARPVVFEGGIAEPESGPLFGLHNRDYPSIWALHRLAELTREGPVGFRDYLEEVTSRAWAYAEALRPLERRLNRKLTVMFPRNPDKRRSSEEGFRAFAVGSVHERGADDRITTAGPLFAWRACQLRRDGRLLIALTEHGYGLLEALDGISLDLPHSPEMAERYFDHLRRFAPGDWWGFETVLEAVAEEPDRAGLMSHFEEARPDWSRAQVGTNAQGYVGRGREWGTIEPKMVQGGYRLTDYGRDVLDRVDRKDGGERT